MEPFPESYLASLIKVNIEPSVVFDYIQPETFEPSNNSENK